MPDLKEEFVESAVREVNKVLLENIYQSKFRNALVLTTSKEQLKEKISNALKTALEQVKR